MTSAADAPKVKLGSREWPIPILAPRQNRIIVPALLKLIPSILKAREEALAARESDFAWLGRLVDEPTYEQLATVTYTALTRANPELQRPEFDDMPIGTLELISAIFVIARQAGLFRPHPAAREG